MDPNALRIKVIGAASRNASGTYTVNWQVEPHQGVKWPILGGQVDAVVLVLYDTPGGAPGARWTDVRVARRRPPRGHRLEHELWV